MNILEIIEKKRENKELTKQEIEYFVKGYVEGLLDGVADTPEKQKKYLRTIYNKANEQQT